MKRLIRDSLHFEYAGQTSEDMGLYNINIGRGMANEPFVANIELVEEVIRGRDKPYFKKTRRQPLSFSVAFAFQENWDEDKIREVARWLTNHQIYQPLRFYQNIEDIDNSRIFFALIVEGSDIVHNYLKQGYITLTIRCDSPWGYLPIVEEDKGTANNFKLENLGDLPLFPRLQITKLGDGPLLITNSDNGSKIEFFSKRAGSALLRLTGTVYDGETVEIGDEIYEFDTGDGEIDENHEIVDLYQGGTLTADFARGLLNFQEDGFIKEGDTITIGNDIYEFDVDGFYRHANIQVDISDFVAYATGRLTLNENPEPYDQIVIGNTRYIFDIGTNKNLIKTTNHGVDARGGFFGIVNRSRPMSGASDLNFKFVVAKNRDFLELVSYTKNNPFDNPVPATGELAGQQPDDVIEIYSSKYRGIIDAGGSTVSHLVTDDTQGLRTGDVVGLVKTDGALEFRKIKAVSNNVSMSLETAASAVPSVFYAFNRVALRVAEGARFEIPNIVVIGADKEESASNLVNAINLTGVPSLDFGVNLKQNLLVEAELESEYGGSGYGEASIILTSRFAGSQGNVIVTTVSSGMDAYFDSDKLEGGLDCPVEYAKAKLLEAIEERGREKIEVDPDVPDEPNKIHFRYKIGGTIGNGVICLANAEDASWEEEYFEGGKDPLKQEIIDALIDAINHEYQIVEAEEYEHANDMIKVTHLLEGLDTNIPIKSDAYNLFWSSRRLTGGRNELVNGEVIMIDCDRQQIESNEDDFDRYDCFSDTYIELDVGENNIAITEGDCEIKFWLLPKVIQG